MRLHFLFVAVTLLLVSATNAQSPAKLDDLILPPGFSIEVFSDDVPNARSMALGDAGTIFVATKTQGKVFALVPQDSGAPTLVEIAKGLRSRR